MQKMKLATIALGLVLAFCAYGQQAVNTRKLAIKITNIQKKGKTLYVGIYRAGDEFPEFSKYWKNTKVITTGSEMQVEFEVPFGDYALAISHDLNGNGKLDKNIFGYPSEPFGFSNNFKPKLSSPDFSDCKFTFTQQNSLLTIKLID
jgi:uncharacterized protein (DUF2141 family)